VKRRRFLATFGTTVGLAGCLRLESDGATSAGRRSTTTRRGTTTVGAATTDSRTPTDTETPTETRTPIQTEAPPDVPVAGASPQYAVDEQNGGYVPVSGPTVKPTELWLRGIGSRVQKVAPCLVDETVVAAAGDGFVHGFDARTGEERWAQGVSGLGGTCITGDTVLVGNHSGAYGLDLEDGAVRWQYLALENAVAGIAATADAAVFLTETGDLVHLDPTTGAKVWETSIVERVYATPAIADGTVYVAINEGVKALSLADGATKFTFTTPDADAADNEETKEAPTVADGTVYVANFNGHLYAVDAASGALEWNTDVGISMRSSPAVRDGTVYVGADSGEVVACDAATGSVEWRSAERPTIVSGPVGATDDGIYAMVLTGTLVCLHPDDGSVRWEYDLPTAPSWLGTAVADAYVFAMDGEGGLHALTTAD
jgi:outer membrane protein assembly factor BamB